MATAKFKMPSDKKIWQEVDAELAAYPETFKKLNRVPERQKLFDKKKKWYQDEPKRREAAAKELKKQAHAKVAQIASDEAYLALRRVQGSPIITLKKFKADFPNLKEVDLVNATQQQLHEAYDLSVLIAEAKAIHKKITRIRALSRKYLLVYLAKTYGLYLKILRSSVSDVTFNDIQALLWNQYKIKTHHDTPKSSLLLKMVFEGASDKTIHLYTRAFQLASGNEVPESDFADFIKQVGGMEKIRKAYAIAYAANAGEWRPSYEVDAEYAASRNTLLEQKPFAVAHFLGGSVPRLKHDIFGHYSLVMARIDLNGQLELYAQLPGGHAIENQIVKLLSDKHRKEGTASWLNHKRKSNAQSAIITQEKIIAEDEKALNEAREKERATAKKKSAVDGRRSAEQQTPEKSVSRKTSTKTKK